MPMTPAPITIARADQIECGMVAMSRISSLSMIDLPSKGIVADGRDACRWQAGSRSPVTRTISPSALATSSVWRVDKAGKAAHVLDAIAGELVFEHLDFVVERDEKAPGADRRPRSPA